MTKGRWLANVMFQHYSERVLKGTKKVKNMGGVLKTGIVKDSPVKFLGKRTAFSHYFDSESNEEVEDGECHFDCPVKKLDEQSGITTSGVSKKPHEAYDGKSVTGFIRGCSSSDNQYDGTGGAFRFFKVIGKLSNQS